MKPWKEIREQSSLTPEQRAEDDAWVAATTEDLQHPPSDDHPGGPLSRAERVLLSHLKNRTMEARTAISSLSQLMGAIPGAQKIESAQREALTAIDRLLQAMKTRKQGAPPGNASEQGTAPQGAKAVKEIP